MKRLTYFLVFCIAGIFSLGADSPQMFIDRSFDSVRKKEKNPYWWRLTSDKDGVALSDQKDKRHGSASLHISAVKKSAAVSYLRNFSSGPGVRWKVNVWAKGKGKLQFAFEEYICNFDLAGRRRGKEVLSPEFQLTENWQQYEYVYTGKTPGLVEFNPRFRISGIDASAHLDEASCYNVSVPGAQIFSIPLNCTTTPGKIQEIKFNSPGEAIEACLQHLGGSSAVKLKDGILKFKAPDRPGIYPISLMDTVNGTGRNYFIQVLATEDYNRLEKASSRLKNPGRVLIIGDSLSDYLRGRNWVDMVEHFCHQRFGEKTVFFNYAIGGDQVDRTLARLKKVPKTYALERYQGIETCRPDTVFIFLGHNDSLLRNRNLGFKSPTLVPPELFKKTYTELIQFVRQKYNSPRIILISPVYMVYAKTWRHRFGNPKLVYGEPVILKNYRDMVQQLAGELNCDFIDAHTLLKKQKDPESFSLYDGIHINLKGNHLLAEHVLEFLSL